MKEIVEEMNQIHKRIAELQDRINDFYQDIGSGNSLGKELRDSICRDKIEELTKEYNMLMARLKDLFVE